MNKITYKQIMRRKNIYDKNDIKVVKWNEIFNIFVSQLKMSSKKTEIEEKIDKIFSYIKFLRFYSNIIIRKGKKVIRFSKIQIVLNIPLKERDPYLLIGENANVTMLISISKGLIIRTHHAPAISDNLGSDWFPNALANWVSIQRNIHEIEVIQCYRDLRDRETNDGNNRQNIYRNDTTFLKTKKR